MGRPVIKTLLVRWTYNGKTFEETTSKYYSEGQCRFHFNEHNAGELISIKKTKRKHPFYREIVK